MTYEWAGWLLPALEADPFVRDRLVLVDGWASFGRPGSFFPSGQIAHHTACMLNVGHDPRSCLNVCLSGNQVAPGPIGHGLITATPVGVRWDGGNPDPRVYLFAAGRANHAGRGVYRWGAPEGNGSSIGWEACGPGAVWPDQMVELYERVLAAVARNRWWSEDQVTTHWEYARPHGRKIDPSGSWVGQRGLGRLVPWSPAVLRSRVAARMEDDMIVEVNRRVYDTRPKSWGGLGSNGGRPLSGRVTVVPPGLPPGTRHLHCVVTVDGAESPGYLTVWSSGNQPLVATMNYMPGDRFKNGYPLVSLSGFGSFDLAASAPVNVIVDVVSAVVAR